MTNRCPNINHRDWKILEETYGTDATWALYLANEREIPSLAEVSDLLEDLRDPNGGRIVYELNIPSDNNVEKFKEAKVLTHRDKRTFYKGFEPLKSEENRSQKEIDNNIIDKVNNVIEEQLSSMGIGIRVMDDFQEINGEFDPQGALNAATGLVELIKIAKGERGKQALPEEYAHLVDAILKDQDNPLYSRLMALVNNEEVVRNILESDGEGLYDEYARMYNNDFERLQAEARAKLISKHIMNNEPMTGNVWDSLMRRVKDFFKRLFGKGESVDFARKIDAINKEYFSFATSLLGGEIPLVFDLDTVRMQNRMFQLASSIERLDAVVDVLLDTRSRQLQIGERLGKFDHKELKKVKAETVKIDRLRAQGKSIQGILIGAQSAYEDLQKVIEDSRQFSFDSKSTVVQLNEVANQFRKLKEFSDAYKPLTEAIHDYTNSREYVKGDSPELEKLSKELLGLIADTESLYKNYSKPLYVEFLKRFAGNYIGSTVRGTVITEEIFEEIVTKAEKDIGFGEKWLYSMANSSDIVLRLIERPMKELNAERRRLGNMYKHDLMYAQEQLEKAGHKNAHFMYELDANGKPTGYFHDKVDTEAFKEESERVLGEILERHGNPSAFSPGLREAIREHKEWVKENTDDYNYPLPEKFPSKVWLSWDSAQQQFYDTIMAMKYEGTKMLPENKQELLLAPQYRKEMMDIIKDSKTPSEASRRYLTLMGDQVLEREVDDEFGARAGLTKMDGTEYQVLPVYYTTKLENLDQLSLDVIDTMSLYMDMATTYKLSNEVIDIMELSRDFIINERKVPISKGGFVTKETFRVAGRKISNPVYKPKHASNMVDRLNSFFDSQLYGVRTRDAGGFKLPFSNKRVSMAKVASTLNKYTAMNTYAFNLLGGAANVLTGEAMTRIETMAGEFIGHKENLEANRMYIKWLPDFISDLGRRRDKTLPSLLIEKFNVLQDYETAIRDIRMNQKNLLTRYLRGSTAYFVNNAGEHYLAVKLFLGMAERYKLRDSSGREVRLIDVYEMGRDAKGMEVLKLKDGITKLDGSEFTEADVHAFSRKYAGVHQNLHGIYNQEDMNMLQTYAVGQMAMMFRKWMPPAVYRRFSNDQYDFDLDQVHVGYYRTLGRFLQNLYNEMRQNSISIPMYWKQIDTKTKQDIWRALTEIGYVISMATGFMFLHSWEFGPEWKDDDSWFKDFMMYQMRRQVTEVGVMVPLGITQATEVLTIIQSPAAAVNYTEHLLNTLRIWDIFREPLQSGPYKGWNRYARDIVRPLPYHNAIRRAFYPSEALKVFTN